MADTPQIPSELPAWPLFGWAADIRPALKEMVERGASGVLGTLYAVAGGAPRPVGTQVLMWGGAMHGFMSGGCIEGDLAGHAGEVGASGRPQRLIYGEGSPFADIRLVCGGRVDILLEKVTAGDPAVVELLDAYSSRRCALWASNGWTRACISNGAQPDHRESRPVAEALAALSRTPQALCAQLPNGAAVALRYAPQPRLVVVGHDPTALAIASLAAQSGFETHLVRPKGPVDPPPLAQVAYHRNDAEEALAAIGLDAWTYVAVATHALEEDENALKAALTSPAAYVGVLGARRRLPERLARLRAAGLSPQALERLHAPIGLDIGGKTPFEVAISTLAEIIAHTNRTRPELVITIGAQTEAA